MACRIVKGIDKPKGLKTLLTAGSDGWHDALESHYRGKSRKCQPSVRLDKREFATPLVREADDAADRNGFRTTYCITKELVCSERSFDSPVKDVAVWSDIYVTITRELYRINNKRPVRAIVEGSSYRH